MNEINLEKLEQENLDKISGADESINPYANTINLAEKAGLVFTNDYNEDGEPEFIGTISQWEKFNELNK
jgi:hypothetical protein